MRATTAPLASTASTAPLTGAGGQTCPARCTGQVGLAVTVPVAPVACSGPDDALAVVVVVVSFADGGGLSVRIDVVAGTLVGRIDVVETDVVEIDVEIDVEVVVEVVEEEVAVVAALVGPPQPDAMRIKTTKPDRNVQARTGVYGRSCDWFGISDEPLDRRFTHVHTGTTWPAGGPRWA